MRAGTPMHTHTQKQTLREHLVKNIQMPSPISFSLGFSKQLEIMPSDRKPKCSISYSVFLERLPCAKPVVGPGVGAGNREEEPTSSWACNLVMEKGSMPKKTRGSRRK